ncbi:MAG TPA: polyphosphate kinase 1 [Abditibacteriaceae bacterium]|jgi:polyphosphate kinase
MRKRSASAKETTKPAKPKAASAKVVRDLSRPEFFLNRELSWLEFNGRVLEEAQDPSNPVLERLKFLTIVSSNLDEFFEIRVAGLQQQAEAQPGVCGPDGLTASKTLDAIATRVRRLVRDQYKCLREGVLPDLAASGIDLLTVDELSPRAQKWATEYFEREVFPVLTPLAIDPAHPFPQLLNKSLNLAVVLHIPNSPGELDGLRHDGNHEDTRFGVVQVPRVLPRLVALPTAVSPSGRKVYVFQSSIISANIGRLFPGLAVEGCYSFRVTRNGELYLDEDEADNLLEAMREQLQQRRRGDAVRLEVQRGCDPAVVEMLLHTFDLEPIDLYEVDGPVNLPRLMAVYSGEKRPDLKDPPFVTAKPHALEDAENAEEFFAAIRHEDTLLHHPYDSFKSTVDFVRRASEDPNVLAIKQTLYRAGGDSPIVRALMRAAENGKQVTALVELKARFDEENNIAWARAMEQAGVHVLYGLVGLKTHCKMCLVVRREGNEMRRYCHLGTGNYNAVTARLYTDIGLLTARADIAEDMAKIFNLLTGMSQFPGLAKLKMAPFGLRDWFVEKIERETAQAKKLKRAGVKPENDAVRPRIVAKMNALVDPRVIEALYRASQAGVQVQLIVRGVCCLRPGIPGVSENVEVRSIIDRFLEHARIFYFANGGEEEFYCGSADWMPRNFFRRVEVMFPVEDERLKRRLKDEILSAQLADNVKARLIQSDGSHVRAKRDAARDEKPFRSQKWLVRHTAEERAHAVPHDFLDARMAAAPESDFPLQPRPAPQLIAPHATDGRAGTQNDPVLQSLAAEGERETRDDREPRSAERAETESERPITTVISEEAPPVDASDSEKSRRAVKSTRK